MRPTLLDVVLVAIAAALVLSVVWITRNIAWLVP
jgi:hypothetical protein